MKSHLAKMSDELNEKFREALDAAFFAKFKVELETTYSIFSMSLVSKRKDRKPMTQIQHGFCFAYGEGYAHAMGLVTARDTKNISDRERKKHGG